MSGGKATSPWLSVFVLGILAGAYIGFGGLLSTTVTFDLVAQVGIGLTKFLAGSAFSLGLMLVVIAAAELFTDNNLLVSSVMTRNVTFGTMVERRVHGVRCQLYRIDYSGIDLLLLGALEDWQRSAGVCCC
ncbi:MAG: hypothetical protein A2Y65_07130 [Deltaproteobacteria bacterium RBG_13_52_11]|nr:MAG: hypothetical protein A2Y65_07130 [Deltaproteobacteria bacterium RBG_13_52_11]